MKYIIWLIVLYNIGTMMMQYIIPYSMVSNSLKNI